MNRYTPKKMTPGVTYFNHFPKNFLVPYGRQKPLPADDKLFQRLRPEGCEWLRPPHTAMSELGSTLNENMAVLQDDEVFLDEGKVGQFADGVEPLAAILHKFHKDYEGPNSEEDKRAAALAIVNPSPLLKAQMLQAVEVGGALFSMGINFMVANRLFANPEVYADLLTCAPKPDPAFKSTKHITDLLPLLHVPKHGTVPTSTSTSMEQLLAALSNPPCHPSTSQTAPPFGTVPNTPMPPSAILAATSTHRRKRSRLPSTTSRANQEEIQKEPQA